MTTHATRTHVMQNLFHILHAAQGDNRTYRNFLNGSWVELGADGHFEVVNPALGERVALVPACTESQMAEAIEEADIERAASGTCKGVFKNSGQRCDAVSRVLVHRKIHYRFLDGVMPGMEIAREEIFGPVMPVMTFEEIEDAIEISNSSDYGLDSFVFSEDLAAALQDGSVTINSAPAHGVCHFPFGGNKKSAVRRSIPSFSRSTLKRAGVTPCRSAKTSTTTIPHACGESGVTRSPSHRVIPTRVGKASNLASHFRL